MTRELSSSSEIDAYDILRVGVANIVRDAVAVTKNALPRGERTLGGEILEVRDVRVPSHTSPQEFRDLWRIVVRDTQEERTIVATMPRQGDRPIEGQTIGIRGVYDLEVDEVDTSVQIVFVGHRRARGWRINQTTRTSRRIENLKQLDSLVPATLTKRPRRVVLVTSSSSAALGDFFASLGRAGDLIECEKAWISLEKGTPAEIAEQILKVECLAPDLVVIMRGGGRRIMLERFSEPEVVRAIATLGSKIPLVVAIGHRKDEVDAERFAWRAVPTPTAAGSVVARAVWKPPLVANEERRPVTPPRLQAAPAIERQPANDVVAQPNKASLLYPIVRVRRSRWLVAALMLGLPATFVGGWYASGSIQAAKRAYSSDEIRNPSESPPHRQVVPRPMIKAPEVGQRRPKKRAARRATAGDEVLPPSL